MMARRHLSRDEQLYLIGALFPPLWPILLSALIYGLIGAAMKSRKLKDYTNAD